jgi:hypothetical protein
MLRDLLCRRLPSGSRVYRHRLRQIWSILRNTRFLWSVLRVLYHRLRAATDSQRYTQRRSCSGHHHRFTYCPPKSAQYCAIHLWRMDESDWLAIWLRLHPQLLGSSMDHLQLRLRSINIRGGQ